VYVSALQQAEELFMAASEVGYASRPLLAFYGLSQAGRAIAAAATRASGDDWRLTGHGLTAPNLDAELPDLTICQQGGPNTSFTRLARILRSPLLPRRTDPHSVTLAELWDTLPETAARPLLSGAERRPAMYFTCVDTGDLHPLASGILHGIPPEVTDGRERRDAFDAFMRAYPTAAGYDLVRAGADTDAPRYQFHGTVDLQMHWAAGSPEATAAQRLDRIARVMTRYNGAWYLMPAVGGNDRPFHPLLAWWAVLYVLSMLARYQPAEWAAHIDVNSSPYAVDLELLLTDILVALPSLIHETISQV
jgi:hypothetical protein